MSLTSYNGLIASLEAWLNRTDLTALLPDFIALNEARLNRLLRVPAMEGTATYSNSTGTQALPVDYLAAREIKIDGLVANAMSPQQLHEQYQYTSAGTPVAYTITGTSLVLAPVPGSAVTITMDYYQRIPALTSVNTSNWLLTSYPDAYLYGTLAIAAAHLRDDENAANWKGAWDEVIAEIKLAGVKQRIPDGPLVQRGTMFE